MGRRVKPKYSFKINDLYDKFKNDSCSSEMSGGIIMNKKMDVRL